MNNKAPGEFVVKPINKPKRNQSLKVEPKTRIPKGGVKIGDYIKADKWRCRTCKYLNGVEFNECTTCGDPKNVKKKVEQKKRAIY